MSLQEILEVVSVVEAVTQRFFLYFAITDDRTCEDCMRYDGQLMTRREMERRFPYLEKVSDELWFPHVHPNCRCECHLWEEK